MENRNLEEELQVPPQATTHLDFKQAMQDFQTMFPEMDQVVIEEVLRANQGEVDATIDQLLSMTTDNVNEALRLHLEEEENGGCFQVNKCTANYPDVAKSSFICSSHGKKWCPPLIGPLPPTFLRISSSPQKVAPDCGEDERIALFLQNEEFLSELRVNSDFMSTLDQDGCEKGAGAGGGGGGGGPDIEAFKDRLRNMGKISRNKFAQLSKVFQRRKKNRSAKGMLEQSGAGDSMFWGAEPLLSENQDESTAAATATSTTVTATTATIGQRDTFSK